MNTTARKPSATLVETLYGVERTITATRTDSGNTRRGATYAVAVDDAVVGFAQYLGGRRYYLTEADGTNGYEYVTNSDGGKVSEAMAYVAYTEVTEAGIR